MRWSDATLNVLDDAAASARDGKPAVVSIEGEPGFGKSTLLREAVSRLDDFHVLRAFGEESAQDDDLQLLREWDALPDGAPVPRHTLQAMRLLAQVVDRLQLTGPVALVIDDLQWIDTASVAAVTALVQRAAGDRLLVLAATRPLGLRHSSWRNLTDDAILVRVIRLEGLTNEAAVDLVSSVDASAPAGLAEQLRSHTGGSPLHMRALLRERSTRELAALAGRGELPAPTELASAVHARVSALAPDAARLLHALAVLGDAWTDLPRAAAVAGVADAETALSVLGREGLVRIDRTRAVPRARISHGVIRAAVYESISPPVRRRLHAAAAARSSAFGDQLQHRFMATEGVNEGLAEDLDRHADALHAAERYREAARFRHLAAIVTGETSRKEHRELDAEFETILTRDLEDSSFGTRSFGDSSFIDVEVSASPQRRLVEAMRLTVTKEWARAMDLMETFTGDDFVALGPLNAYRARVLRGWAIVTTGRDPLEARRWLDEAAAAGVRDPALRTNVTFAYGEAMRATIERNEPLWGFDDVAGTDRATLAGSPAGLAQLSWRGSVYALTGFTDQAIGDLSTVIERIGAGTMEFGDGVFYSLLGFAQWTSGEWRRASINLDLPLATPLGAVHPLAIAASPLSAIVKGEDSREAISRSRAARLAAPYPPAIQLGDLAEVASLGFAGSRTERHDWLARRTADFGDPALLSAGAVPYLWLVAMGLGAAWADDAESVDLWADELAARDGTTWIPTAVAWLKALSSGLRGQETASSLFDAAQRGLPGLASFEALLWVDAATAAARESSPLGQTIRERADAALVTLGAARYAAALLPSLENEVALGPEFADPLAALSDREREVVALMMEGLSYAQIAQELYVTRGTVAFHLSNAYAKTGTTSRHELVRLLRPRV